MNIAGLQKMTLLDYPGKIACTAFLQGCNFRCPFCHNSDLLPGEGPEGMDRDGFLSFLQKRRGLLDAVCISGGEPTLQPELEGLLAEIKALGFAVKLDTNGSRPDVLKQLVSAGLLDYVAMDIKNSPQRYGETAGRAGLPMDTLEESIGFLLQGAVDYEFRTTVAEELHGEEDIRSMGQWLIQLCPGRKPKQWFLQPYVERESVLRPGFHAPSEEKLADFVEILRPFAERVEIRGQG